MILTPRVPESQVGKLSARSLLVPALPLLLVALLGSAPAARGQATFPDSTRLHAPTPALPAPGAGEGLSGDPYAYHVGDSLFCADCHSMHFSMEHGFDGGAVATIGALGGSWLPAAGPNTYLLKAPSSTELCLECHDGKTFAPDVVTTDSNGLVLRAAGHFENVGVPNFRGHNLSTDPDAGLFNPPCGRCHFGGTMATASVQCIDCHAPHGNLSHRNLQWASNPGGQPPLVAYIAPGDLGLGRYEADNVAYAAPPSGTSSWREITNMCFDCHHTFFSPVYTQGSSPFEKHPGTYTEWGAYHPIDNPGANTDPAFWTTGGASFLVERAKFIVVGATDFASASVVAPDNEVFCLSCHQAHGTQNPFALRWGYEGTGPDAPDLCYQCHRQVFTGD